MLIITFGLSKNEMQIIRIFIFCAYYIADIAINYRLDGIEFQWGRDFPPFQTGPGAHPASCKMGTESFLGVK